MIKWILSTFVQAKLQNSIYVVNFVRLDLVWYVWLFGYVWFGMFGLDWLHLSWVDVCLGWWPNHFDGSNIVLWHFAMILNCLFKTKVTSPDQICWGIFKYFECLLHVFLYFFRIFCGNSIISSHCSVRALSFQCF